LRLGIRWHMKVFLAAIAQRSKPVADLEQGYISTAACILVFDGRQCVSNITRTRPG
jgi:hypothetical protein